MNDLSGISVRIGVEERDTKEPVHFDEFRDLCHGVENIESKVDFGRFGLQVGTVSGMHSSTGKKRRY